VLGPVGAVRQALGQELLQQQLPDGAPGLGRSQQVLQPAQAPGLLEDLLGHPGDHRHPLAHLGGGVGGPGLRVLHAVQPQVQPPVQVDQPPVEAVGDPGQPPVQLPARPDAIAPPAPAPERQPGHDPGQQADDHRLPAHRDRPPGRGPSWPGRYQRPATITRWLAAAAARDGGSRGRIWALRLRRSIRYGPGRA
jgi:hypothetical protein